MLEGILAWLTDLPPVALYAALALFAAAENVFPPLPADTIVAFGAFLAARGEASLPGAFLATWLGNVGGALAMYGVGRRIGAERLTRRFPALGLSQGATTRLADLYGTYGVPALFLTRFLPAVRAIVPPVAGMLRVPFPTAAIAIALASAVWYGTIAALAYSVGARWDQLAERMANVGRTTGVVAVAVVVIVACVVLVRRRRRRQR